MKNFSKLISLMSILLLSSLAFAQPKNDKASWKYSLSKTDFAVGETINVIFDVNVIDGWYIYGSDFDPDCGPMVTIVTPEKNASFEVVGKLKTVGGHGKFDDIFECDITYFKKNGQFVLPIKVLSKDLKIKGTYEFQTCAESGVCLPGDGKFEISQSSTAQGIKATVETVTPEKVEKSPKTEENTPTSTEESTTIVEEKDSITKNVTIAEEETTSSATEIVKQSTKRKAGYDDIVVNRYGSENTEKAQDIWALLVFMGISFGSGLIALLTPCVFPMIPMTVSFFTHGSSSKGQAIRKALFYGFSIVLIYVLIGTVVAKVNGPGFANWLATHPVPNIIFFVLFVVFALSFLGLFEIQLPSSFVNKVDAQSDKGGFIGIFFMAFTLVLVSFSCTGPIASTILIESAGGSWLKPLAGMLGYSLAFAIPFTLFAIFPSWLQNLPKSGGWLNTIKVVLGLLELALAFKFLSVADQVNHWHLLDREVFLAIWLGIFAVMGIYLLGKVSFPHDSPIEKIGVFRGVFAIVVISFVFYLLPGMWGAPLKALSGILPPITTQDFNLARNENKQGNRLYSDKLHVPHGLDGYFDIREAIDASRKQNKPIFLDFTGHGCANCRQMEAQVWSDNRVLDKLQNDFIVVALYGDDKKITVAENEWFKNEEGEIKKTLGEQTSYFMYDKFQQQGQPFYAILGVNENAESNKIVLNELASNRSFDLDIDKYVAFLKEGITNYKQLNK
ncbi:MAG: DUF255 domain-containing protein [Cytophagales bacterium]|nr:DUF255 domain-containing protein [Cytophagales bacterium]